MNKKAIVIVILGIFLITSFIGLSAIGTKINSPEIYSVVINSSTGNSDDWSMWQHDLENTGYSTSDGPDIEHILWRYKTGEKIDTIRSSASVANGKVYFGAMGGWDISTWRGCFYCIDAETAETIWKYETDKWILSSAPAISSGRVYVGVCHDGLYCFNAETGNVLWKYESEGMIESSPAVTNERVYFSKIGKVYCLDAITGAEIWTSIYGGIRTSVAIANNKIYIGGPNEDNVFIHDIYCLDATTGDLIWNKTLGDAIDSSPIIFDGKVYISSMSTYESGEEYGMIYCLNTDNGDIIWSDIIGDSACSPAVAYGRVYIGDYDCKVYCYDAYTGELLWGYTTLQVVRSAPAIADGKVYVNAWDFYCLDAFTGKCIWHLQSQETGGQDGWFVFLSPAITDGKIYIGSENTHLYCFGEPSSNPPETPTINGPKEGMAGVKYTYSFVSTDPDGDRISYIVEWGNGDSTGLLGPYESGETREVTNTWVISGAFIIKAKARDIHGAESDWAILTVTMPRNRAINPPFLRLLEQFPNMFPLLRYLLEL